MRANEIVIVAIAHLKRRPGYWKKRRQPHSGSGKPAFVGLIVRL
jgi:hypothetical protein